MRGLGAGGLIGEQDVTNLLGDVYITPARPRPPPFVAGMSGLASPRGSRFDEHDHGE
jgi:hypothetical protein